ncbi:MAG TPA: hypothetical protein EYN12_05100, partial [Deltaproteobacteria bacterium]|nr:hypothetical protein [Deltaproteobacteria bacterium]
MYSLFSVLRFLVTLVFLCVFSAGISSFSLIAQTTANSDLSARISEIEIIGTSELESSQIMFLIESQVGDILDRKTIRKD